MIVLLILQVACGKSEVSAQEEAVTDKSENPSHEDRSWADSEISIGTRFSMASNTLGEDRPYWVSLPASYNNGKADQRYPVVYLLDGAAHFHSASGVLQFMSSGINGNRQIPELILVAIPNTNRTRDLTPTHSIVGPGGKEQQAFAASGGGDAFLGFLRDELVPRIDSTYRTLPHRTIVGHSFGGLWALHALLEMPALFNAYIAIDPSLWWDNKVLLRRAQKLLAAGVGASADIYISLANNPDIGLFDPQINDEAGRAFAALLSEASPELLRTTLQYFAAEDHGSVPLLSLYNGLLAIFDGYKMPIVDVIATPSAVGAHFKRLSERLGVVLLPPEALVDQWGALLLDEVGDTEKAMQLFELNSENFPDSSGAKWRLNMLHDTNVQLRPELLAEYVGDYAFSPEFHLTITIEEGLLISQATGQGKVTIFAESETEFYTKVVNARLTFVRGSEGTVSKLILHQDGRDETGIRVK